MDRGIVFDFSGHLVIGVYEGFIADFSAFKFGFRNFTCFFMLLHEDAMNAIGFNRVLTNASHELSIL